jgi:glutamate---cysteine ligase / carboxylate-amine ligase
MKEIPRSEFTVGVEEELHLVDPETNRLRPIAADVLDALNIPEGSAGHEAYAAQIELRTTPCATAQDAREQLAGARRAAAAAGATLMGAGLHPTDTWGDTALVDDPRYREVADDMRDIFARTPEAALHVHVGMPDVETAIHVFNGLRRHLPLLIALGANSPWWFNHDSGLASARWALVRSYPGRGVPPEFIDWAHYVEHIAQVGMGGGPPDYTLVWWDIRPHPRLGTVEIRELDAQSSLESVEGIAALVQALARREADAPRGRTLPPAEAIAWSCFRAARDGLDAEVLHEGDVVPVRLALAGLGVPEVEPLLAQDPAARRRAAHARGGPEEMLRELVAETGDV